jgi:hypothetical protein
VTEIKKNLLAAAGILFLGQTFQLFHSTNAKANNCPLTDFDVELSGQRFCFPDRYFDLSDFEAIKTHNTKFRFLNDNQKTMHFQKNRPTQIAIVSLKTPDVPLIDDYPLTLIDGMNVYWAIDYSTLGESVKLASGAYDDQFRVTFSSNPGLTRQAFDLSFDEKNGLKSPKIKSDYPVFYIWNSEFAIWYSLVCDSKASTVNEVTRTVNSKVHYYSGTSCDTYNLPFEPGIKVRFQFNPARIPVSSFPKLYDNIRLFLNQFRMKNL